VFVEKRMNGTGWRRTRCWSFRHGAADALRSPQVGQGFTSIAQRRAHGGAAAVDRPSTISGSGLFKLEKRMDATSHPHPTDASHRRLGEVLHRGRMPTRGTATTRPCAIKNCCAGGLLRPHDPARLSPNNRRQRGADRIGACRHHRVLFLDHALEQARDDVTPLALDRLQIASASSRVVRYRALAPNCWRARLPTRDARSRLSRNALRIAATGLVEFRALAGRFGARR